MKNARGHGSEKGIVRARRPIADLFWPKVDRRGPDECWPWLGAKNNQGYGQQWRDGRLLLAHRVSYELLVETIPDGLTIDHVKARGCVRKDCVNPAHLEPVTFRVNVLRGESMSARNARKANCQNGHPYDVADGHGRRHCRRCYNATQRDRRHRATARAATEATCLPS